jgi:uncharacterized protein YjiS (DUF1127 family)
MAYVSNTARSGFAQQGSGLLARLRDALNRRRIYNKTYSELSALSTRELTDLGVNRSMITRLAHEAAYGK